MLRINRDFAFESQFVIVRELPMEFEIWEGQGRDIDKRVLLKAGIDL
jgi:hypothetical protein